jgi:hypothetical protein
MKRALLLLAACAQARTEAAPRDHAPSIDVAPVDVANVCVTKGELAQRSVAVPTMRGYAIGAGGDAAQLTFTYRGETEDAAALASGDVRRQIGLKLRAANSCNVVYVMWRLDPRPALDVSVKANPGMTTHEQCGATGYTKVKPYKKPYVPAFEYGKTHTLRAEIVGDELFAWVDSKLLWQGRLPETARSIQGPAGLRSDNVKFDLVELAAPHGEGQSACKREGAD